MAPEHDAYLGMTKWHARTGAPFKGQATPCGCAASFLPTKPRYIIDKASPRTSIGMFMGYRLQTGSRLSGAQVA